MPDTPPQPVTLRSFQFTLFLTGVLWIAAAGNVATHAAQGIATRLNLPLCEDLLQQAFYLFLLLCGFAGIGWISTRNGGIRFNNALPNRATTLQEWSRGAALGWAMLLVAVLPMTFAGALHPQLSFTLSSWGLAALSFITLLLSSLALEIAFRGYIFRRLIDAVGTVFATFLQSLIYALYFSVFPHSTTFSTFVTFLTAVLFSMAYLRTHALWLGWGLHFAWIASMGVLLGLPVCGLSTYTSLVDTTPGGPLWLTGGFYGPEGALLTAIFLSAAMIVLYRLTREYAWQYTHPTIIAAGYPMDIAPPKAHTDMEQAAAAKPAPLVQILSTTSTTSSTLPIIDEHLRSTTKSDNDN